MKSATDKGVSKREIKNRRSSHGADDHAEIMECQFKMMMEGLFVILYL